MIYTYLYCFCTVDLLTEYYAGFLYQQVTTTFQDIHKISDEQ